jgi:hypothetical protein
MAYPYLCDHCGKKFELETPLAKECPFCFWTSSVKREDELASEKKGTLVSSARAAAPSFRSKVSSGNLKYLVRVLVILVITAAVGFLGVWAYERFAPSVSKGWKAFSIKLPVDSKRSSGIPAPAGIKALSAQEKEILHREVTIPADRIPSADEQAVLGRVVPFQTGWTEKLPSAVWTLEQYRKMIADQETFYKMPFARSYKKKLEELFKARYLLASDAFAKGDVLTARNLWVESLAFPLYSTDLKKHRAVALTMLRPFINDTLAKVSAMNQSLAGRGKRVREEALSASYQRLGVLITQKKWPEAVAVIDQMTPEVDFLRKNAKVQEAPPQYPASFGTIDPDLQRPLMDLMTPGPSSMADLQPLQQDLVEKKEVLETFTEAYVKDALAIYRAALGLIRKEKWQEAAQALGSIQGPPALQQDAAEKMAVLAKIMKDLVQSPS